MQVIFLSIWNVRIDVIYCYCFGTQTFCLKPCTSYQSLESIVKCGIADNYYYLIAWKHLFLWLNMLKPRWMGLSYAQWAYDNPQFYLFVVLLTFQRDLQMHTCRWLCNVQQCTSILTYLSIFTVMMRWVRHNSTFTLPLHIFRGHCSRFLYLR